MAASPGQGRPARGSPQPAHSPGPLMGREAPSVSGKAAEAVGGGSDLILNCHTLMGMENVNFLCIPGTIPWGGDL